MQKQLITEENFKDWLKSKDFSEVTPSGRKSTIYSYLNRVKKICSREGFEDLIELSNHIDSIVVKYNKGGSEEKIGLESNSTVINALKQFQEFVNQN